jgi:hypothetical protein
MSENQAEPQPEPQPEVTTFELEPPEYVVVEKGDDESHVATRDLDK